jgi:glycosyltransferase involved in cell wall biosynthesis
MPRVSVIIPTHNRAGLIGRAVRSALTQTFSDLEVLVIDDASKDGTGETVLGISDPRVRYLRHETNRGVSVARNTALSAASGQFIAFLDDDDEWLPDKLRLQLDCIERARKSVGLVTTGFLVANSADSTTFEVIPSQRGWLFESLLRQGSFNHTSTIMARAECFERVGLFDDTFRYGEDFDMWLRIAREYEVDLVSTSLVRVCPQPNGLTQDYDAKVFGREAHLNKYCDFFEHNSHVFNERLQTLGTEYCFAGNTKQGRQVFYKAIARRPLAAKSYVSAALSLMGPDAVRSCYRFKDWCGRGETPVTTLRDTIASLYAKVAGRAEPAADR